MYIGNTFMNLADNTIFMYYFTIILQMLID